MKASQNERDKFHKWLPEEHHDAWLPGEARKRGLGPFFGIAETPSSTRYLATILFTLLLAAPAISADCFDTEVHGGALEYLFEIISRTAQSLWIASFSNISIF
jgi:hypothetical protein